MSMIRINIDDLKQLAIIAERNDTLSVFADVAIQWAEQANAEIERLQNEVEYFEQNMRSCEK